MSDKIVAPKSTVEFCQLLDRLWADALRKSAEQGKLQIAQKYILRELGEQTYGRHAFYFVQTVIAEDITRRGNILVITVCLAQKEKGRYMRTCAACHWRDEFDPARGMVLAGRRMLRRLRDKGGCYIRPRTSGILVAVAPFQGDSGVLQSREQEMMKDWPPFPPAKRKRKPKGKTTKK